MKQVIIESLAESARIKSAMAADGALLDVVAAAARALRGVVEGGGCVYACGNGGSACDAMHLCEELIARFKRERKGMRAMHFMDPGVLTCWANDYSFDTVFERCAETFCRKGDALVAFSTSGASRNVAAAVRCARAQGAATIALTGKDGGLLREAAEYPIIVPAKETERIQEAHIALVHIFCELLER